MDDFISIKDLEKGTPSKTQSLVHDGDEGTKRIEFAELLSAVLKTADYSADAPTKTDSVVVDGAGGANKIAFSDLLAAIIGASNINTAGFHNSIYRGKDITEYFNDGSLYDRIAGTNGYAPFEDLYVGDYIKMPRKVCVVGDDCDNAGTDIVKIAGFNCHWKNYWSGNMLTKPHIDLVPDRNFGDCQPMNDSSDTTGGYKNSKMNKTIIGAPATAGNPNGTINEQLYNIFGSHLQTYRELVSSAMDPARYNRFGQATGASSQWDWIEVQAILMSEIEVYGSTVWSSSGYDTGTAKNQLPIFRLNTADLINSEYYWLRDVASAGYFCRVDHGGRANYNYADSGDYLRPRFVIA